MNPRCHFGDNAAEIAANAAGTAIRRLLCLSLTVVNMVIATEEEQIWSVSVVEGMG